MKRISYLLTAIFFIICLCGCDLNKTQFKLVDARMALGIDGKLKPVNLTDTFSGDTTKVYCWFKWENAKVNTPITANWHYVTDNIPILNYTFNIPRKEGMGSVSLSMPAGKVLPAGLYRLDLKMENEPLKSLRFTVKEKG